MNRYAAATSVPVDRSKAEIERLITRYGADHFASGWIGNKATIGFRAHERLVRFDLPLPKPDDPAFTDKRRPNGVAYGRPRSKDQARALWEQACRASWRALALVVKAKLEAVESGITSFESEFMAHIVIPKTGKTVGDALLPEIAAAYAGKSPRLLLTAGGE